MSTKDASIAMSRADIVSMVELLYAKYVTKANLIPRVTTYDA